MDIFYTFAPLWGNTLPCFLVPKGHLEAFLNLEKVGKHMLCSILTHSAVALFLILFFLLMTHAAGSIANYITFVKLFGKNKRRSHHGDETAPKVVGKRGWIIFNRV